MIYDCFSFFNELDILEIRLNTLNEVVDKFVLVENLFCLYENTPIAEKMIVENATHAMAYSVAGVVYEKKISDFLKSRTNIF